MSSALMRNGSNTGTRRYTDSNENEESDATFPVAKNPVCNRIKKNSAIRASDNANFLNEVFLVTACPFMPFVNITGASYDIPSFVSSSLHNTSVAKKIT